MILKVAAKAEDLEIPGEGEFIGLMVPVMGFKWAVFLAQVTLGLP